ncbi:MAG: phosphohydrolase, partial [Deltaproteobacteria bacterium]|nr:phosphohydrolase [Deltaproteobacteria bacterium]
KTFVNPGFLKGPYLPIYGTGAFILTICATHLEGSSLFVKGLVYLFVTTGLEFITGFIFDGCLHTPLWDYSGQRFRIKNYVCLQFSIYWLVLAFAFEYLVLPVYLSVFNLFNPVAVNIFAIVVSGVIFADWTVRCAGIIWGRKEKRRLLSGDDESEFMSIAKSLIDHPDVRRLAAFRHHHYKTRLDHSVEVAWHSFLLSKRFSLDCDAIVKGALLHDLFFYDWLREGPRLHGFRHPWISLKNAREVTTISKKEKDIITKHMWPLTIIPPRYLESWVVCFVDTCCTVKDYLSANRRDRLELTR